MGDVEFLGQLVDSMADAVEKLEEVKSQNKITEFNRLKNFILDIQKKIDGELND